MSDKFYFFSFFSLSFLSFIGGSTQILRNTLEIKFLTPNGMIPTLLQPSKQAFLTFSLFL